MTPLKIDDKATRSLDNSLENRALKLGLGGIVLWVIASLCSSGAATLTWADLLIAFATIGEKIALLALAIYLVDKWAKREQIEIVREIVEGSTLHEAVSRDIKREYLASIPLLIKDFKFNELTADDVFAEPDQNRLRETWVKAFLDSKSFRIKGSSGRRVAFRLYEHQLAIETCNPHTSPLYMVDKIERSKDANSLVFMILDPRDKFAVAKYADFTKDKATHQAKINEERRRLEVYGTILMLSRCHRDVLIVFHNDSPTQGVEIFEHCAAVGLYAHGDSIYTNYWFRARRNGNPSRMVDNLTYDFTYHMDKAMSITNSKQTLSIKKEDYVPTKDRNIEHCERELKLLQDYGYEVNDPSRTAPQELDWLLSSVRPRTEPGEVDADGAPNQVV